LRMSPDSEICYRYSVTEGLKPKVHLPQAFRFAGQFSLLAIGRTAPQASLLPDG